MGIILNWLLSALTILASAYLLPGVHVESFTAALVAAVVLGIMNAVIKPILLVLTLPITILTLGLFTFVINAFVILLAARIVPGFSVDGFGWALVFSVILSCVGSFVHHMDR